MITPQDKELLMQKGISEEQIAEQLACFEKGFPYLKLAAAASLEKEFWLLQQMSKSSISMHGTLIPGQIRL